MARPAPNLPLPTGYRLDRYCIERQLSSGGFSIVYLARDAEGTQVAIKEYLPARLARRDGASSVPSVLPEHRPAFNLGMKSFFEEGRILARLNHPNLVQVLNFFRANETVYLVMRYESGRNLQEFIRARGDSGRPIAEDFLREVFVRLLSGLREVHKEKLLHLDIKPANIFLRSDGQPVLLDFGASRHGLGGGDPNLSAVSTPGFAAPEQEGSGEALGPWTDIYGVGATLYACLACRPPLAAADRLRRDDLEPAARRWRGSYSAQLLELIDWSMQLPAASRPQSVYALQKVLNGELLDLVDPSWFERPEPPAA
jgi:hypothetical protein